MADLTPRDLLEHIVTVCANSPIVTAYALRILDLDILSVRVVLVDNSVIEVFHNAATEKTAFALIAEGHRVYGKDNAKMGWHVHPLSMIPMLISSAIRSPSKRSSWCGGCDSQRVLPFGTPEEVADEGKRRMDDLAPGGDCVFSPIYNAQTGVPPENVVAMFKAAREYGVYHSLARWWQAVDRLGARHLEPF